MQKAGIAAFLDDLALRLRSIGHRSDDARTRIALEELSTELSNKAFGLAEAFALPDPSGRQRSAQKR